MRAGAFKGSEVLGWQKMARLSFRKGIERVSALVAIRSLFRQFVKGTLSVIFEIVAASASAAAVLNMGFDLDGLVLAAVAILDPTSSKHYCIRFAQSAGPSSENA